MKFLSYGLVGLVEMLFSTQYTVWVTEKKATLASAALLLQNIVWFFVIYQLISNVTENWPIFISYAVGNSLGTFLVLRLGKKR